MVTPHTASASKSAWPLTELGIVSIKFLWLSRRLYHFSMMTSSNGNIFRITGHLCGEFTGPGEFPAQRPVTWSFFDVFFDLRLNERLSKQPWGWWFETPPWSSWRQCNVWRNDVIQDGWQDLSALYVRYSYSAVNFVKNPHNRHPINIECFVSSEPDLRLPLSLQCCRWYSETCL